MHRLAGRIGHALLAAAVVAAGSLVGHPAGAQEQELPEGFEQILPRGRIASIDEPGWVPASEAEIPDDAIVMGVVIDGQPRALSINLLNAHEVVNDKIGDTAYAAVW